MMHILSSISSGPYSPWMTHAVSYMVLLIPLVLLDVGLKGWGMWRAARMGKNIWFIALLIVNSLGILPAVFLLLTKDEYARHKQ